MTLAATSDNSSATSAKAGSAGKISISPTVALTIVSNNTLATIGTGGTLTVGSLDAVAKHSGNTSTTTDAAAAGSTVGIGAALSLNIVDDTTIATTARNITSTVGDISFGAYAYAATGATAKAGAAGADPDAEQKEGENTAEDQAADQKPKKTSEDQANEQIDSVEDNPNADKHKGAIKGKAKTSSGSVSIAAGLALNLVDSTAKASLADGLIINSAGSFKLATSNETDAGAIADGSAVGGVSAIGVGVAVALNIVDITNEATIGQSTTGTANVTAKGVILEAKMSDSSLKGDGFSNFTAQATAGAGANNVGVAGSFALNAIGENSSIALIKSGAIVDAGGGDVEIIAQNNTNSVTLAEAVQVASPDGTPQVGVGASVAIDFEQNRAEASLQDNSTLTNAGKLTLAATSDNSSATSVKAGSAGNISVSPAVALTIVSNNTKATIGSGGTLTVASLDAVAKHSGNTSTTADAAAAGNTVGVGAALSLNIVDDNTIATTARNITSTAGEISFGAYAYAATGATAKAGSAGADPDAKEENDNNTPEDQAGEKRKKTSEDQANEQIDSVEDNPNAEKHKGAIGGKAKSNSDGAVSIAAALALNLANSTTKAILADNLVINAAGAFKLGASNETDGSAIADGSAVDGSNKVGIGAAVALNIVNASNQATLSTGAKVSADGVTLEAKMSDETLGGDGVSAFKAESTSGAGAQNVGVAGSFALNFVNNSNEAVIKSGANVNAGSGDITLIAANNETDDVKATSDASGGNVGVGASIGMNLLLKNSVRAEIEDNVILSGGGSLTLDAKSERAVTTTVEAGSSGGVAVSPAVSIAIVNNDTTARLGAGAGTLDLSGNVSIKAERIGSVITEGNATAAGDKVAVGAIVAVNVVKDNTSAALMRDITTSGGSVVVASTSNLTSNALVLASASGNKQDGREADDEASAQSGQKTMPSAKDSVNQSNSSASSSSGGTGGAGVGVAAAVGVNWQIATNKAIIGSNVRVITKGGAVTVSATNQTNAKARAIGTSMSDTATANVSAAVGLNVADVNNIASVGSQAIINAQSTDGKKGDIKIEAVTPDESTNEFIVWGFAASGGNSENSKASVAGSIGVNVLTFNSQALVGNEAQLATSGAIDVIANSPISLQNLAISGAFSTSTTGGAAGAAIVVNVVTQSSIASIGANATLDASESISVSAESSLSPRAANIEDLLSIVDAVSGQLGSLAPEIPGLDELFAPLQEVEQPLVDQIRTVINEQKNAFPPELTPPIYDLALQELDNLVALKQQGLVDLKTYLQELIDLAKSIAADFFKDFATEVLNLVPFSNVAIGAGVSDGKVGIGGSVIVNIFNANTLAYVSSGTQINQGANTTAGNDQSVNLFAKDTTKVKNVAGGLGVGTGAVGIGIGVDVEILYRNVGAYIDSSTTTATKVKAAKGVSVQSSTDQDIFNLTLSGGLGGKLGVGGTVAVNQITNNVIAGISGTIQTEGDVSIAAIDNSKILALAGGLAVAAELKQAPEGGPKASIGAAVAVNKIASTTYATINRANVTTSGALNVNANSNAEIKSVTIAGSGSVSKGNSSLSFAAGASIAINTINSSIIAEIANGSTVKVGGQNTLAISAKDNSKIEAFALGGALAVAVSSGGTGGTLAIGVSAARNEINNTTAAYIDSSTVGSSNNTDVNIDLQALSTNTISAQSIAVAISVAKGSTGVALSGGGAGAGNFILTKTNAYVKDSNLSNNIGNVAIKANNTSNIDATVVAVSGSVAIGDSTGVGASIGAAVANNFIGYDEGSNRKPSEVQAYIQNSSVKANGNLTLNALADENIVARVGAGSVAVAASTGGTGLSGSGSGVVTLNKIATLIKAFVNGATSIEAKTATLTATDSSKIKADAGAASIAVAAASTTGGSLSIGVSVATNLISNEVEAFISGASNVRTTTGGISLSAITKPTIEAVSVAASIAVGAAGTTGVGISGAGAAAINTILTKTNAYIKDSVIASAGAIALAATNTATIDAKIAAVSVAVGGGGTTGVGVSIGMAVANNYIGYDDSNRQPSEVQAYIQNSSLTANQDLTLNALSGGIITAGVGAGSAAVSGGGTTGVAAGGSGVVTLNKIATLVKAFIDGDGKTGIQASTATLNAKDTSKITADAGAASLAIGGGGTTGVSLSIGVSVASNLISNEVEAFIKNAGNLKTTTGLLSLAASTDAAIKAVSVAASIAAGGGGTAGVTISGAGAAAVNTILTKTNAYIKDSVVTSAGSVNLAATNSATIDAKIAAVSVSAGGGGTAGVGVSIGAAVANNSIGYDGSTRQPAEVQAYIQNSSMSAASGDLTLSAINNGSITAGVGAGSAAVSGGGTAGVAASGSGVSTENKIATLVKAFIDKDGATGIQAKTATLTAKDSSIISADAGAASVAASFGGTAGVSLSIGVSIANNLISNEVEAFIRSANNVKTTTGNISLSATTDASIRAVSVAASIAASFGGTAGVAISGAGAASINTILTKTNAYIKDSAVNSAGAVSLDARNTATISATVAAVSASVSGGGTAGVGVSIGAAVANNSIGYDNNGDRTPAEVQAYIQNSSLAVGGDLTLNAINDGAITAGVGAGSAAISGGGTAGVAASGSGVSTENKIATLVKAFIDGDGATGIQAKTAALTAKDSSTISADAGAASIAASFSGNASVSLSIGVALARNTVTNEVQAFIQNADSSVRTTTGDVSLSATTDANIKALSVAASLAVGVSATAGVAVSGAGAESTNTISTKTNAYIKDSVVNSAGAVGINAKNTAGISAKVGAGSAAVGGGKGGVGASIGVAVARNLIGWGVDTTDKNYKYTTGSGTQSLNKGDRVLIAQGARAGDIYEFTGDPASIDLETADYAKTSDWKQVNLKQNASEVLAYVNSSSINAGNALTLTSLSSSTIEANVASLSVAVSAGIGGASLSGAGVGTENKIATKVQAYIDGDGSAGIKAGSVGLTANDTSSISASAEAASIAATFAIGAAISVGVSIAINEIANDVRAFVQNVKNGLTATSGSIQLTAKETSTITAISVAASAAVALVGVAGAGAVATNTITNAAKSYISNAAQVKANGDVALTSSDTSTIRSLAGQFSGGTAAAIGVSVATNTISNQIIAEVANSNVISSTGAIGINATSNSTIETLGIGGSVGGAVAAAGATTLNRITSTTSANTRGVSTLQAAGAVTLVASDDSTIKSLAGQLSVGGAAGVGAGVATNDIANTIIAELGGTAVTAGSVALSATSNGYVGSIAVGASSGGAFALGGAITLNKIANVIRAGTSGGSSITTTGSVSLQASDTPTIESLAGQVSDAGGASVGLSLAKNEISSQVIAEISNTTFKAKAASVSLTATSVGSIRSAAVGGAAAGALAAGGSVTLNTIRKVVKAAISDGSDVQSQGAVSLTAFDNSPILSLAGQVAVAGAATIGIAVATNDIANQVIAEVNNSKATSLTGVTLNATSTGSIKTLGIAGAVSGGFSGAGAVTLNSIANVIKANIVNGSDIQSAGNLNLTAKEDAKIESLAGSISVGGAASVGASVATNNISSQIIAEVNNSQVAVSAGDINLSATSTGTIDSLAAGGTDAGTFAAGGAVTVNNLSNTVRANIANGSDVQAQGNVGLTATNSATIQSLAGQITGAGGAAIGASVAINNSSNTTQAYISDSTVDSKGLLKAVAKNTGTIKSASAGASISGGVALTGSVSVNNITNTTDAHASNVTISSLSGVEISAVDEATIQSFAGQISVGIGAAGVGAAVAYNNIGNIVTAYVTAEDGKNTTIDTSGNVIVSASGKGIIDTIAAGGSAGLFVGAGASVAVNQMSNNVSASVQNNSTIKAKGSVGVLADSTNSMTTKGGTFSAGFIGLGGTIAVNNLENTTRAYVNNSSIDAGSEQSIVIPKTDGSGTDESFQGVAVLATSKDNLGVTIGTGGVGGFAFVASVAVNNFKNITEAYGNNVAINATSGSSIPQQSVYIKAFNDSTVNVNAGTAGGGLAAVGVGIDITTMKNATSAYINSSDLINSPGSIVNANKDLVVEAKTQKSLNSNVVALGGGLGFSVQGAVSIINVSSAMSSDGVKAASDTQNRVEQQLRDLNGMGKDSNGKSNISTKSVSNSFATSLPTLQGTTAFITGRASAGNNLIVNAYETTKLNVAVGSLSAGLISVGGAVGVANITHNASAYVGERSRLTGGNITIQSTGFVDSTAVRAVAGSAGAVGLGAAVAYLSSENNSKAYVGNYAVVTQASNVDVIARSSSNLNAQGLGASYGLAAGGIVIANVRETGTTQAYIGDEVAVENTDNLNVKAIANEAVTATSQASSGGIISGNSTETSATVNPNVAAYIGNNSTIKVAKDVNVVSDVSVDGDAASKGGSYGLVGVGLAFSQVNANPVINTYIGTNTTIEAGNVTISSSLGKAPVSADTSFNPGNAVNNTADSITFTNNHGLRTGDTVVYSNGGGGNIGGLENQASYTVIVVNDETVKLGSEFTGSEVDTKFNTIKFANGHNFNNGQQVIFEAENGNNVGGLTSGQKYYVKVIDGSTIQLSNTSNIDDITEGARLSGITTVAGATTIQANKDKDTANIFQNGDTVTYKKRSALFTVDEQLPDTGGKPNIFNLNTGDIVSKDTINSASHGFETGDQVIYTATGTALGGLTSGQKYYVKKVDDNKFQLSATLGGATIDIIGATAGTSHKITAVGLRLATIRNFTYETANNNLISMANHGFSSGQAVRYNSGQKSIGGLTNGETYYVIKVDDNSFRLTSTSGGAAISLTATNASGLQSLTAVGPELEEGLSYHIKNSTATTFQLSETSGGQAISLDTVGLTGTGASHLFVKQSAVDLTSASAGRYNLHLDLENGTATGTKHLLSSGASIVLPSQGDQVFSAYSQASSGAAIAGSGAKAGIGITPTTNTYVGNGASILATGNVKVQGLSNVQVTGAASTNTGGIVGVGIGELNAKIENNNKTTIFSNAIINAAGNVTIDGQSTHKFNVSTDSTAGGLIPIGRATATATVIHNTITDIGSQANITSQRDLMVYSGSDTSGFVNASANGGGLIPFAYGTANINVEGANEARVNSATLTARKLTVESAVDNLNVNALGLGKAGGLIGIIQGKSNINLNGTRAITTIGSGASLKADELNLNAIFRNVNSNSTALGYCDGLGGKTDSDATNYMNLTAAVNTDANSTLTVNSLNVKSGFDIFNETTYAYSKKAWELRIWTPFGDIVITLDFGRAKSDDKQINPQSFTNFNSNVVRLARQVNPVLVVNASGQVSLKSDNVTVTDNGTDINVGNISATGGGKVTFSSGAKSTGGSFIDNGKYSATDPAFDSVEIQNYSNKNLIINDIGAISTGSGVSLADYSRVNVSKTINATTSSGPLATNPTLVTINNWGNSNLILKGVINNPHDRTILYSNGNIFSQGATQKIITRDLKMTAVNGSIGANGQRIAAQLNQGYTPVTSNVLSSNIALDVEAENSTYLDLTAKGLDDNPLTVNIQKMTAKRGEVNLTIGQTTNKSNTSISALYKFTGKDASNRGISAGTNIAINAGSTTTNINTTTEFSGIAGSLDVVTGGLIKIENVGEELNIKQAVSHQNSVELSGKNVALINDALVQAATDVTLTATKLSMLNNANLQAATDVTFLVEENFQINSTATVNAGNNVMIQGDYNNKALTGTSITIDGWIYAQNMSIYGNTKKDIFNIRRLATTTNVYTGGDDDIVNIGSSQNQVNEIQKRLSVYGGMQNDVDTLNINNSGDTSNSIGVLTNTSVTGLGMGEGIYYDGFEVLNINLGAGNDDFTMLNTSATTNIDSGAGNDKFRIGSKLDANGNVLDETIDGIVISGTNILGTSNVTNIKTGAGNDYIQVNRNTGLLNIEGESGDDVFVINTPIAYSSSLANATVNISGNDDYDTTMINSSSLLETIQNNGSSVNVINSRLINLATIENLIINQNSSGTSSSSGSGGTNTTSGGDDTLDSLADRTQVDSTNNSNTNSGINALLQALLSR
ncbi:hypothetical protein DSM106972_020360 [Dulcicalothrix desertica PCC 7102]|uniref:Uncharacterized protein n=1 Tax=Dulcicalothrix desertica PCC 7102 TaxID=232991 RepID=A0A433VNU6_9CYAN|nr:hypothetical protein DSM106972_020360 [Dulcicalothrix desertica PCC 7102]